MKDIKILLKKKNKTKRENMVVNTMKISRKMKSKNWLSIEKGITRHKKISERSLKKVSVSSYKSDNEAILEWSNLWSLAMRVVEIGVILGQSEALILSIISLFFLVRKSFNFFSGRLRLPYNNSQNI